MKRGLWSELPHNGDPHHKVGDNLPHAFSRNDNLLWVGVCVCWLKPSMTSLQVWGVRFTVKQNTERGKKKKTGHMIAIMNPTHPGVWELFHLLQRKRGWMGGGGNGVAQKCKRSGRFEYQTADRRVSSSLRCCRKWNARREGGLVLHVWKRLVLLSEWKKVTRLQNLGWKQERGEGPLFPTLLLHKCIPTCKWRHETSASEGIRPLSQRDRSIQQAVNVSAGGGGGGRWHCRWPAAARCRCLASNAGTLGIQERNRHLWMGILLSQMCAYKLWLTKLVPVFPRRTEQKYF